jgi:hypothetical protein
MTYKSESLKVLEKNGIGYRNPNVGTIGFQEALLTLEFEYEELANEDILDTLYDQGYISEPSYEEAVAFINNQQVKANEVMYSVWLCATREDVRDNYPDDYETEEVYEIESYTLPPEYIVLSDLGSQGILIMFPDSGFSYIKKEDVEGFEPVEDEELYESLRDNKAVSGNDVSEYVKWITEDPDMVPDSWLTAYVEPNEWVLKQIPIKSLYVDKSFKEALDYELGLMDDPNYYYRYKPEEVEDRDSLYNPIVFYNKPGDEIVIDGYSRIIEHIFNGEEYIDAYILADYEDLVDNN